MADTIARHNRRGWRLDKPSLDQPNDGAVCERGLEGIVAKRATGTSPEAAVGRRAASP